VVVRQLFEVAWPSSAPSSASPSLPLTKIRSPGLAPFRRTAIPLFTSPSTLILISTRSFRVVSPPAKGHLSLLAGLHQPLQEAIQPGFQRNSPVGPNSRGNTWDRRPSPPRHSLPASGISNQRPRLDANLSKSVGLRETNPSSRRCRIPSSASKWLRRLRCSPQLRIFLDRTITRSRRARNFTHDWTLRYIVLLPCIFACSSPLPCFASICRFNLSNSYSGQEFTACPKLGH